MEPNLIEIIIQNFKPTNQEQERIKFYLETHRSNCNYYINNNPKYKERITMLQTLYKTIQADLCYDILQQLIEGDN